MFKLVDKKLEDSKNLDQPTKNLLLDTLIKSANTKTQLERLKVIFYGKSYTTENLSLNTEKPTEVSVQHKHAIVKAFFRSKEATEEAKKAMMAALEAIPEGKDNLELTQRYCEAADPTAKEAMWNMYFDFSEDRPTKNWGTHAFQHSFAGFN